MKTLELDRDPKNPLHWMPVPLPVISPEQINARAEAFGLTDKVKHEKASFPRSQRPDLATQIRNRLTTSRNLRTFANRQPAADAHDSALFQPVGKNPDLGTYYVAERK